MNEFYARLANELTALGDKRAVRNILGSMQGPRAILNGREVIIMSSTNYLGLASHPKVIEGAKQAVDALGAGTASGPRICGVTSLHRQLEERLAKLLRAEESVLYNSAFQANVGLFPCIAREGDIIFSDELNHASIVDGCRLSRAETKVYKHTNMKQLEEMLQVSGQYGLRLIITDGVFSMDGDLAPLHDLLDLARKYKAILCVDDAHGLGVIGKNGRGTAEYYGVEGEIHIQTGTLGKALGGGVGGYVAGTSDLASYLIQHSRTYRFTNTLPPGDVGASLAAIDVMEGRPELRDILWQNVDYFRDEVRKLGFDMVTSVTPIVPILTYEEEHAFRMSVELMELGVFMQAYGVPVVPKGLARLRVIVTAAHSREDLDRVIYALGVVGRKLGLLSKRRAVT